MSAVSSLRPRVLISSGLVVLEFKAPPPQVLRNMDSQKIQTGGPDARDRTVGTRLLLWDTCLLPQFPPPSPAPASPAHVPPYPGAGRPGRQHPAGGGAAPLTWGVLLDSWGCPWRGGGSSSCSLAAATPASPPAARCTRSGGPGSGVGAERRPTAGEGPGDPAFLTRPRPRKPGLACSALRPPPSREARRQPPPLPDPGARAPRLSTPDPRVRVPSPFPQTPESWPPAPPPPDPGVRASNPSSLGPGVWARDPFAFFCQLNVNPRQIPTLCSHPHFSRSPRPDINQLGLGSDKARGSGRQWMWGALPT